jgi:hypothetical protein
MILVLIVLTVYRPNTGYLEMQLRSIQDQSFENFECVVSYDGQFPTEVRDVVKPYLSDKRFSLWERESRLGTYQHVELLISSKFNDHQYLALSDQDDIWERDKLESQLSFLQSNDLSVVSDDAMLIDDHGREKKLGLFKLLQISQRSLDFVCFVNACSGAGSLYDKKVIQNALPFPSDEIGLVHDHWLAAVGMCLAGIELREEKTWRYRQHGANQIGVPTRVFGIRSARLLLKKVLSIIWRVVKTEKHAANTTALIIENSLNARGLRFPTNTYSPTTGLALGRDFKLLSFSSLRSSRMSSIEIFLNQKSRIRKL